MLNFGSFEKILEDYSSLDRKDLGIILLNAPLIDFSKDDKATYLTCCRIDQSLISDYCNGKRPIPKNIIANFSKSSALERAKKGIEKEITSCIFDSSKSKILQEVISLIQKDSGISDTQKEHFSEIATMEHLADFLAEVLVYVVQKRDSKNKVVKLPIQNRFFCGRQEILEGVESNFKKGIHSQSLHGLGGLGKTQIALQYAHTNIDNYKMVWWLNAENHLSLQAGVADLLKNLKISPKNKNTESERKAFLEYLSQNSDWLLIYDNAEYGTEAEYQTLRSYYPEGIVKGHVLFTTRCGSTFEDVRPVDIPLFSPKDAIHFLHERSGEKDETLAMKLAERLGFLPLALEYAAAYIRETPYVSYEEYIDKLDEHSIEVLDRKVGHLDYAYTVREAFHITLDKLLQNAQTDQASAAANQFLCICAFLAPDGIQIEIFSSYGEQLPEPIRVVVKDDLYCDDMTRKLVNYSLLQIKQDGVSIHRLLQEILIDEMEVENREKWLLIIRNIFKLYKKDLEKLSSKKRVESIRQIIPHVQNVLSKHIDLCKETNKVMPERLYEKVGNEYLDWVTEGSPGPGMLITALDRSDDSFFIDLQYARLALDYYEKILKHDDGSLVSAVLLFAGHFYAAKDSGSLRNMYLRAIKIVRKGLVEDLPNFSDNVFLGFINSNTWTSPAILRDLTCLNMEDLTIDGVVNVVAEISIIDFMYKYKNSFINLKLSEHEDHFATRKHYGYEALHLAMHQLQYALVIYVRIHNGRSYEDSNLALTCIHYLYNVIGNLPDRNIKTVVKTIDILYKNRQVSPSEVSDKELYYFGFFADKALYEYSHDEEYERPLDILRKLDIDSADSDIKRETFKTIISLAEKSGDQDIKQEYMRKLEELNF